MIGCQFKTGSNVLDAKVPDAAFSDAAFLKFQSAPFLKAVDSYLSAASNNNTKWSVDIRALGPKGEKIILYRNGSTELVRPASTLKIFTSWAYFHLFPEVNRKEGDYFNMQAMMKSSNNTEAQMYLDNAAKKIGGTSKIIKLFRDHGINGVFPVDGSGLSYHNKVNAHSLVRTLWGIHVGEYGKSFRDLLPIAGVDGTLSERNGLSKSACGGTVIAKTGTLIEDPSTDLAGYAIANKGWLLIFALLGDSPKSVDHGREAIDQTLCHAIRALNSTYGL